MGSETAGIQLRAAMNEPRKWDALGLPDGKSIIMLPAPAVREHNAAVDAYLSQCELAAQAHNRQITPAQCPSRCTKYLDDVGRMEKAYDALLAKFHQATDEIQQLKRPLAFYADPATYGWWEKHECTQHDRAIDRDAGQRAREALR